MDMMLLLVAAVVVVIMLEAVVQVDTNILHLLLA